MELATTFQTTPILTSKVSTNIDVGPTYLKYAGENNSVLKGGRVALDHSTCIHFPLMWSEECTKYV